MDGRGAGKEIQRTGYKKMGLGEEKRRQGGEKMKSVKTGKREALIVK